MLVQAYRDPMFKLSREAVLHLDGPPEPVSKMEKSGCLRGFWVCLKRKNTWHQGYCWGWKTIIVVIYIYIIIITIIIIIIINIITIAIIIVITIIINYY